MFSVSFSLSSMYFIHLARDKSLYLTQIKLVKDATTFIGIRTACRDFVDIGFPSFDFPGLRLGSPFLRPPDAGFQVRSGNEFVSKLVIIIDKTIHRSSP